MTTSNRTPRGVVLRQMTALAALCILFAASAAAGAETFKGMLVYGHEARTFTPCEPGRVYWVGGAPEMRTELQRRYDATVREPYEAVYAEFEGRIGDRATGALSSSRDVGLWVTAIVELRVGSGADCGTTASGAALPAAAAATGGQSAANPQGDASDVDPSIQFAQHNKAGWDSRERTFVFMCKPRGRYVVRATRSLAWVFGPNYTRKLPRARRKQPGNFSDGNFSVEIEGENARIGVVSEPLLECINDSYEAVWEAAKLDGASFRAVGNEPGWHLTINDRTEVDLTADYGNVRFKRKLSPPRTDRATRTTVWRGEGIEVEVVGKRCADTMVDRTYESTVTVRWDGRTLRGCGRALR